MARLTPVTPVGVPQRIIQRGHNRHVYLSRMKVCRLTLDGKKAYSKKYEVTLHAWVLMTNPVHLLGTPESSGGISQMMQSLGQS